MMKDAPTPSLMGRVLRAIPIVGTAIRCIEEERPGQLIALVIGLLLAAAGVVVYFGLPGFVTVLYGLLILVSGSILLITFAR